MRNSGNAQYSHERAGHRPRRHTPHLQRRHNTEKTTLSRLGAEEQRRYQSSPQLIRPVCYSPTSFPEYADIISRRVEMLNADLYLQNEFEKWQKSQKANKKRKVAASNKKTARQKKQEEEEPAFHFIAYVPINGEVWRMDGMQRHPINLGCFDSTSSGNWMSVARENIYTQMARYPNDESYNFMALCKSPLTIIKADLASNARSLHDVEAKLSSTNPDWRSFLPHTSSPSLPANNSEEQEQHHDHSNSDHEPSPPRELSDSYGLTPAIIFAAAPTPVIADRLERAGTDIEALLMLRARLVTEEKRLMRLHCEEVMEDSDQDEKAKMHMIDYGPDMYNLVRELLDSGRLREMWDDL
jgi:ubiquitin carboxyl-terminal hydrolase L5